MKAVPGHALHQSGAPYRIAGPRTLVLANPGRISGTGHGRCECGAVSPELQSGAARKAWHRGHKEQVLAAGQLQTNETGPSAEVIVWTATVAPAIGWALVFNGFDTPMKPKTHAMVSSTGTAKDMALAAMTELHTTLPVGEPVRVIIQDKVVRSLVLANPDIVPDHWVVDRRGAPQEQLDACWELFAPHLKAVLRRKRPVPLLTDGSARGIIIASDASLDPNPRETEDPDSVYFGGIGWVIGGLTTKGFQVGSEPRTLPKQNVEELELLAAERALRCVVEWPWTARRKTLDNVLLQVDSAAAFRKIGLGTTASPGVVGLIHQHLESIGLAHEIRWVRSHSGNPWNIAADRMAEAARRGVDVDDVTLGVAADLNSALQGIGKQRQPPTLVSASPAATPTQISAAAAAFLASRNAPRPRTAEVPPEPIAIEGTAA